MYTATASRFSDLINTTHLPCLSDSILTDSSCSDILNQVAPVKIKRPMTNPASPWLNETTCASEEELSADGKKKNYKSRMKFYLTS